MTQPAYRYVCRQKGTLMMNDQACQRRPGMGNQKSRRGADLMISTSACNDCRGAVALPRPVAIDCRCAETNELLAAKEDEQARLKAIVNQLKRELALAIQIGNKLQQRGSARLAEIVSPTSHTAESGPPALAEHETGPDSVPSKSKQLGQFCIGELVVIANPEPGPAEYFKDQQAVILGWGRHFRARLGVITILLDLCPRELEKSP
jgi:hypothetical protein